MKPHLEAVLTTRMTLPLREERGKGFPVSVGESCQQLYVFFFFFLSLRYRVTHCQPAQSRRKSSRKTWLWWCSSDEVGCEVTSTVMRAGQFE